MEFRLKSVAFAVALAGVTAAAGSASAADGPTLAAVKAAGELKCGVNTGLGGFSIPDSAGNWTGLDVDVCRAVAAAVLGDGNKVKFIGLSAQQRFTALQNGEVDILSRNTTWTLQRDTKLGLNFTNVTFYDGQGFMVPKKLGVKSAKELNGATVCVQTGTTTELNLADYFRAQGMEFKPVVIENQQEVLAAFISGRCDVYTTDASGLASQLVNDIPGGANDYMILPEIISKEPLGPSVRQGDEQWTDIVKYVTFALIQAEESGITAANADEMAGSSKDPNVLAMLGVPNAEGKTSGNGEALGLDEQWALRAIKAVGNYGEIFDRNIKPLGLERGINALWTKGGLMYNPPLR
ncbi:MAG: amino acid ABC transporter substrate-binding protein [Hyphomicrobiaceae bacterium]